eukprot:350715-Chlamydomonas_euryale.AAC.4
MPRRGQSGGRPERICSYAARGRQVAWKVHAPKSLQRRQAFHWRSLQTRPTGFCCCGVVVLWSCGVALMWCCGVVVTCNDT